MSGLVDSAPGNIRTALEGSLKRLRTDHIHMYYQHRIDPATPIEDTVGALSDLVRDAQGDHTVPIPGTRRVSRLEENAAADEIELTTDQLTGLSAILPPVGDSYTDMAAKR